MYQVHLTQVTDKLCIIMYQVHLTQVTDKLYIIMYQVHLTQVRQTLYHNVSSTPQIHNFNGDRH